MIKPILQKIEQEPKQHEEPCWCDKCIRIRVEDFVKAQEEMEKIGRRLP